MFFYIIWVPERNNISGKYIHDVLYRVTLSLGVHFFHIYMGPMTQYAGRTGCRTHRTQYAQDAGRAGSRTHKTQYAQNARCTRPSTYRMRDAHEAGRTRPSTHRMQDAQEAARTRRTRRWTHMMHTNCNSVDNDVTTYRRK